MLYVDNGGLDDPCTNLAIEEHLLRNVTYSEPLLFLYTNRPAVIIGRNQNVFQEVDPAYLRAEGILLLRRLSGGGTVYHDPGNLNFSFIVPGKEDLHKFAKVTAPIIRALSDLGLEAQLKGKSDIFAAGKKISGNAQYASGGRMFSHGTLLFNSNLERLGKAITPRGARIESKAVQSIRSQVINIRDLLPAPMTIKEFQQGLLTSIFGGSTIPRYSLSPAEWTTIHDIANSRYRQWSWTYGRSPKFTIQNSIRLPQGEMKAIIEVKNGLIQALQLKGDHPEVDDGVILLQRLVGLQYDDQSLSPVLENLEPLKSSIGKSKLLELICP